MIDIETIGKDEVFREVMIDGEAYPNYAVSNYGRVYSLRYERVLRGFKNNRGYIDYDLYKDGERKHMKAHRLVGLHFIDNPDDLNIINHKDERRDYNYYKNLEWCTHAYNLNYGNAQLCLGLVHMGSYKEIISGRMPTKRRDDVC